MAGDRRTRDRLLETLELELRHSNAQAALYSHAAAQRFGIGDSDLHCLEIVSQRVSVSAADLAEATGLTAGAITSVVDRLENAGLVERARDSRDRRRVIIRLSTGAAERVAQLHVPIREALAPLCARYSGRELELLIDFLRLSRQASVTATKRLRG